MVSACLTFFAFKKADGVYQTFAVNALMRNEHVLTTGGLPPLDQLRTINHARPRRRVRQAVGHA